MVKMDQESMLKVKMELVGNNLMKMEIGGK
jgi:hypothetical protein